MNKCFSEILREKRKAKGWTLEKLARKANISASAISSYERKGQFPNVFIAIDLANALGCSVYELCGITEKKENKK